MMAQKYRLLIVYNADGGIANMLLHGVHKLVSPSTYPCSLCALTYGAVSMRRSWSDYLAGLGLPVAFHHRDDFAHAYPLAAPELPAILVDEGGDSPRLVISRQELGAMEGLRELISLLGERIGASGQVSRPEAG